MKYINNSTVSITLNAVIQKAKVMYGGKTHEVAAGTKKYILNPGEGDLAINDKIAKTLLDDPIVKALVEEKKLRFPDNQTLEKVYATQEGRAKERAARISNIKDEKPKVENDSVSELKKIVSAQSKQIKALEKLVTEKFESNEPKTTSTRRKS